MTVKDVPEFVLDNLDSLGFTCSMSLARKIRDYAKPLGYEVPAYTLQGIISGAQLPTKKTYNPIAEYFRWDLWEE